MNNDEIGGNKNNETRIRLFLGFLICSFKSCSFSTAEIYPVGDKYTSGESVFKLVDFT